MDQRIQRVIEQAIVKVEAGVEIRVSDLRALVPGLSDSKFNIGLVDALKNHVLRENKKVLRIHHGVLVLDTPEKTIHRSRGEARAAKRKLARASQRLDTVDERGLSAELTARKRSVGDLLDRQITALSHERQKPLTTPIDTVGREADPRLEK